MKADTRSTRAASGTRLLGPFVLVVSALLVLIAALAVGNGAAPLAVGDPGATVRWSLPVAKLLVNLSAATMVGSMVLALFALRSGTRPFDVALDTASIGAAVFTVGSAATAFFTFLNVIPAVPTPAPAFGQQLGRFLVETELGRAWLITTICGAILTVLTFAVRAWAPTLLVTVLAMAALVPMATQGHAGEEASHEAAVMSLIIHTIAAAVWLGGLVLLVVLRPVLERAASQPTLLRYSSIALWAFVVVAVSGTVRASIGLGGWDALWSPYGALVLVKAGTLVVLGVFGARYRRHLIERAGQPSGSRRFWGLIVLEFAFMGIASGAAAALARTPTPGGNEPPVAQSAAQVLTGNVVPPELTASVWLTSTSIDPLWVLVAGFGVFFYLAGVRRLRLRGDSWSPHRTVLWCSGSLALLWVTSGPISVYREYLYSLNALGLTVLAVAIPLLFVLGAPVTLAVHAITPRQDGSRGGREWILWLVQSPAARILTNGYVMSAILIVSLWTTYYTGVFRWALTDPLGYEWLVAHFLVAGCLFVAAFVRTAVVPTYRRVFALVAVIASFSLVGISIITSPGLFMADWFGAMGRQWGPSSLADQATGGILISVFGVVPVAILAGIFLLHRDEERPPRGLAASTTSSAG